MKKLIVRMSALALAAAGLTVGVASVASAGERVMANVPFTFIVNGVRLPAGTYEVRELTDGGGVLAVRNADGQHQAFVTTIDGAPVKDMTSPAELTFEKFENEYFLAGVVTEEGIDREIPLTSKTMQRVIIKTTVHQ